ncbi:MAG: hypothetical protein QM523_02295 [Candidatus Pacebacteria bacterium]|nr:hypothetical protein [Candidatus Paceibacterota bacterium]
MNPNPSEIKVSPSESRLLSAEDSTIALGSFLSILLHLVVLVVVFFGLPYFVREEVVKSPPLSVNLVASNSPIEETRASTPLPPATVASPAAPPAAPKDKESKPQSRKDFLRTMKESLPADSQKSAAVFSKFVQSLDKKNESKAQTDPAAAKKNDKPIAAVKGESPTAGRTLTATQMEAVRRAVEPCWNVDSGARRDNSMQVAIRLTINREGVVQTTSIIDQTRYRSDVAFRAAADAAQRAVENPRCRKLPLPLDSYTQWREAVFIFDPSDN